MLTTQERARCTPEVTNWRGALFMQRWGFVFFNEARGHWAVKGKWQGKRRYFSQIPVRGGRFLTCTSREMADYLQDESSKEITRGCFNPSRYQHAQPLHM